MAPVIPKSGHKKLSTAANLSNLLPTGTVLAFQALIPSFSNNGACLPAHKYLTLSLIVSFSLVCFLSSFTDSFEANGKVYYGVATPRGLFVFNREDNDDNDDDDNDNDEEKGDNAQKKKATSHDQKILYKYRIRFIDFAHAFASLLVFLVFATSSSDVQNCFFPHATANGNALMMNLPLAVGAAVSFFFMLFRTRRRGIGHADTPAPKK
ncbi:hypothetical protein ACOSP7_014983 [Xanthoceras sorbifolium]